MLIGQGRSNAVGGVAAASFGPLVGGTLVEEILICTGDLSGAFEVAMSVTASRCRTVSDVEGGRLLTEGRVAVRGSLVGSTNEYVTLPVWFRSEDGDFLNVAIIDLVIESVGWSVWAKIRTPGKG